MVKFVQICLLHFIYIVPSLNVVILLPNVSQNFNFPPPTTMSCTITPSHCSYEKVLPYRDLYRRRLLKRFYYPHYCVLCQ